MTKYIRTALISAAVLVGCMSCGDVVRDSHAPVLVTVAGLTSKNGNILLSDVAGDASTVNDLVTAVVASQMKDVSVSPTLNNQVTLNRYHVAFARADGRNTQGVDVPYAFDGAITATIPPNDTVSISVEVVRHAAKEETPLVQLATNRNEIATIATITFYGTDAVGNVVSAAGTITVNFGNFAG